MEWGTIPNNRSQFSCEKYQFFLDADFEISNKCCNVMKKSPAKAYAKETGRKPITGQTAQESRLRTQQWLNNGCNGFDMKSPISNPMSFWTEQDVLQYIYDYKLTICSVYGDVVPMEDECGFHQIRLSELEALEDKPKLKTTGCDRTGCVFCGFGCHIGNDDRFVRLKETHPKLYEYIMRPSDKGGLNYKEIIDWINENGNLNIRY